jgi:DNA-binding GntR family transcriptional regulator
MAKRAFLSLVGEPLPEPQDASDAPRTLIERAYIQLRDDIIEGRLAPGEKLRVEHLKERYAVGSGTLREALTRVASDALVQSEGQRGFRVSPVALDDLLQLTDLRLHIELDALRQSIRRGDDEWRSSLQAVFEEMSAFEQPIHLTYRKRWEQLNARFHECLVAACGNQWTLRMLRLLSRQIERYRHLAIGLPNSSRDVHEEHRQIFEAAINGQEARAALALELHVRATPDLLAAAARSGALGGVLADSGQRAP